MQGYGNQNTQDGAYNFNQYNPSQAGLLAGGIGSMGGMLGQMFGDYKNPSDVSNPYFQQAYNLMGGYYNPYIDAGRSAMGQLQNQYSNLTSLGTPLVNQANQLMSGGGQLQNQYSQLEGMLPTIQNQYGAMSTNPGGYINQVGQSFHQSPGFQFQTQQATNAANQAAAAGGMVGSPQEQQNLASSINGMANQDYYNYLGQAMNANQQGLSGMSNLYNQGLQGSQNMFTQGLGLGQNLYGAGLSGLGNMNQMGYNASTGLAGNLANILQQQGMNAYAGQINQNESQGGNWGSLMGGIGDLASFGGLF